MILRARVVLPLTAPAISMARLTFAATAILAVLPWRDLARARGRKHHGEIIDLGDAILLPGLVNAHCHLDYTNMAGQLPSAETIHRLA